MNIKRMARLVLGIVLGAAVCGNSWAQKAEGLASTPQMGWNSWNKFACNIDERLIRETADAMVKSGLKDAGYQYVNIDDCWQGERDADGNIQPDPKLPIRHQGAGGLCAWEGTEAGHLLGRRRDHLRRPSR